MVNILYLKHSPKQLHLKPNACMIEENLARMSRSFETLSYRPDTRLHLYMAHTTKRVQVQS